MLLLLLLLLVLLLIIIIISIIIVIIIIINYYYYYYYYLLLLLLLLLLVLVLLLLLLVLLLLREKEQNCFYELYTLHLNYQGVSHVALLWYIYVRIFISACMFVCVCVGARYFGTAEGSKAVEASSADNVKRTWVDYGIARDWTLTQQGQVEGTYKYRCYTNIYLGGLGDS